MKLGSREKWGYLLFLAVLAFWCNRQFLSADLETILASDVASSIDIPNILEGYRETPNLLVDGLRWWHGPRIEGTPSFRPLASYLMWIESWIGLHWGFACNGWIGYALFVANAFLSAGLALRITGSRLCAALAGAVATMFPLSVFQFALDRGATWLAWYSYHQDLLMNALMLGALLYFDSWCEKGKRGELFVAWVLFLMGCLTKEYVYIFPLFAVVVALCRPCQSRARGARQAALMAICVLALMAYRGLVIPHPYYPAIREFHLVERPVWYFSATLWRYLVTGQHWLPGLAVLIVVLAVLLKRFNHRGDNLTANRSRSVLSFLVALLLVYLYLALSTPSAVEAFWFIFDRVLPGLVLQDLIALVIAMYSIHLLWKYRKQEPAAVAWLCLWLSILPVLPLSIYWHYQLPSWFIRCGVYWPLLVKLVWLDLGKPTARLIVQSPNLIARQYAPPQWK